jgi:arylsulfatase A-like enzyme
LGALGVAAGATAAGGVFMEWRGEGADDTTRRYGDTVLRRRNATTDGPNVLFISLDDCNDWLGFLNNHPGTRTPNLDALATGSLVFEHAYCTAPMCLPSRTSVLFGRQPFATEIYDHSDASWANYEQMAPRTPSLIDDVWAAGYDVVGAGKVFNSAEPQRWTKFRRTRFYGPSLTYDPSWVSPFDGEPFEDPGESEPMDWGPTGHEPADEPDGQAAAWVREQLDGRRDRPLFVGLGLLQTHVPWRIPQKFFDMHPLEDVVVPPYRPQDLDDLGDYARKHIVDAQGHLYENVRSAGLWDDVVQAYQAAISFVDDRAGQVLNELADSGHADDTIVVVWSDHGYHMGEKLHLQKFTLWERGTRVPLLIRVPGTFDDGQRFEPPVSLLDLGPTINELCGVEPHAPYDGASLLPFIGEPALAAERPPVTTWHAGNHAVRRGAWRYIRYQTGEVELYDQARDPDELTNLAGSAEHAVVVAELDRFLPPR